MTEEGSAATSESHDDGDLSTRPGSSAPLCGDASLELFGHGWAPREEQSTGSNSYTGRHRAPDA